MLLNPFTPSEIASAPDEFFGRSDELRTLERSLHLGSVAIQGPMGIGKSSLLARGRLLMEGFGSEHTARSVIAVVDKNLKSIDDAARLLLECFVEVDERQHKAKFKLGTVLEIESGDVVRFFSEGRHLAALKRVLEEQYLKLLLRDREMLVLAIDEADKSPIPLAQLIRSIVTHTQHEHVKRVRFLVAGVSPFFQEMVNEDQGVNRFFYKTISMAPMQPEDAYDMLSTKLNLVLKHAEDSGLALRVDHTIVDRLVRLAGGHPHLLQLLGSHLVEHEEDDPDGVLDARDMTNALRQICYEDRARVYTATLHLLELHDRLEDVRTLLGLAAAGFPTRIARKKAMQAVTQTALQWLVDHNVLSVRSDYDYGLIDEFLRIRLILDSADSSRDAARLERDLIAMSESERRAANVWSNVEDRLIARIDNPDDEPE